MPPRLLLPRLPPLRPMTQGVAAEVPEKRRDGQLRDWTENRLKISTSAGQLPKTIISDIWFQNCGNNLRLMAE